mmetsp:Transcript_67870/g.190100  ORF Transcript_67870/g.190100 Transcript_67870/m.190100 type:complete len:266 (-) Transcript_67870:199-996(-)
MLMPRLRSRQNTGWSRPKQLRQKIEVRRPKMVCVFTKDIASHVGVSTMMSCTASTTAPRAIATKKIARSAFCRHQRIRARLRISHNCSRKRGKFRFKPLNASALSPSESEESELSVTSSGDSADAPRSNNVLCKAPPNRSATASAAPPKVPATFSVAAAAASITFVSGLTCGAGEASPGLSTLSPAMSFVKPMRKARNCPLVTFLAPGVMAMRAITSSTTSSDGCRRHALVSSTFNSPASMEPSRLMSMLSHSSSMALANTAQSS